MGANDGAAGTAVMVQLARTIKPRTLKPTLVFIAFDGEEAPAGVPDADFAAEGLRGSKVAAKRYKDAAAMVLLDFIGQRNLRLIADASADADLWAKVRSAGRKAGGRVFPSDVQGSVQDDHTPVPAAGRARGGPHRLRLRVLPPAPATTCPDLEPSLDATGETMMKLLPTL